jgi:hypothetical protein
MSCQAFNCVVRWLRNKNTARYFEDHPAARDAIATVVQEVIRRKPLPTPASTPCNTDTPSEQAPTPLLSQHIAQEEELDPDDAAPTPLPSNRNTQEEVPDPDDQADQHDNLFVDIHDHSSPAVQQGLGKGGRPPNHTYIENIDDSEPEQTGDGSANLDVCPLTDESDDLRDQDARPDGQVSGQTAALLKYQSDTTQNKPRKRQHNFEGSRDSKRIHIEAADATEVELESRSLQCSRPFEHRPGPNQNKRHDQ